MNRITIRSYTLEGGPFEGEQHVIASDRGFIVLIDLGLLRLGSSPTAAVEAFRQMQIQPRHVYIRTSDNRFIYDGLKR